MSTNIVSISKNTRQVNDFIPIAFDTMMISSKKNFGGIEGI